MSSSPSPAPNADAPNYPADRTLRYRAVFISDLHLGSAQSRLSEIETFLRDVECDRLYLVGDILDAWVGSRTVRKKPAHANVLMALLRKASNTCT
ncbi:MAG: hypothetical protein SFX74_11615, partial [Fimbriimonadaceae bacterium]|nr:hypothetical protein [Fimbriimonadaceae bacterium]